MQGFIYTWRYSPNISAIVFHKIFPEEQVKYVLETNKRKTHNSVKKTIIYYNCYYCQQMGESYWKMVVHGYKWWIMVSALIILLVMEMV